MSHPPAARPLALLGVAVLLSLGSGLAALPAAATASPSAATPTAAPLTGKEYVALGDSFTADWGVDPVAADQPSTGCRQSTNDYPHQVAANLGLTLTDVSCAGALTTNMTQSQTTFPDGLSHPAAKPQFDGLTATTEIVTIGIGGNDFGFSDIAGSCAVDPLTGYVFGDNWPSYFTTCKDYYDPGGDPADDALRQRIAAVVGPAVEQTVTAIRALSPKAAIFYVDYLALSTDKVNAPNPATYPDSCYSSLLYSQAFPFGAVDTVYLADLQKLFTDTVTTRAAAAGATVVSTYAESLSHSPCYGTADPWVNGITATLTSAPAPEGTATAPATPPSPTGTPPGSPLDSQLGSSHVAIGSLHPNIEGAIQQSQAVTFRILDTLTGTPVGTPSPTATTSTDTSTTTTSTTTTTAGSGSSTATAVTTSTSPEASTAPPSSSASTAGGRTDPPAAAARPGLASTGSSSGLLLLAGAALVVLGLVVLLLRRGLHRPDAGAR
jgi:lysophospholipase L1-like esterase